MLGVAGGIAAVLQEELAFLVALGALTGEESVFLGGVYIIDKAFLRLEVEGYSVAVILCVAHLEHWSSLQISDSVFHSCGSHKTAVHVHRDVGTREVHVLIHHV